MRLICWLRAIWRTLASAWLFEGVGICDFIEQEKGSLRCENCGGAA